MSLETRLVALAGRVSAEVKAVRALADLSLENTPFSQQGTLVVKVGKTPYPIKGGTYSIVTVAAAVDTAPTGAAVILDVNKNGTTIYGTQGNRPTIAVGAKIATTGAHSVTSLTDGDVLTVDIDQVGSTVAGADLTLVIRMKRTA